MLFFDTYEFSLSKLLCRFTMALYVYNAIIILYWLKNPLIRTFMEVKRYFEKEKEIIHEEEESEDPVKKPLIKDNEGDLNPDETSKYISKTTSIHEVSKNKVVIDSKFLPSDIQKINKSQGES
uniref:Uncharacterized protein n=1 Tax=Parastrongyloides trichosuri TaxID=131310 RepID=A0A0N4ZFE0_PARTI